jgi:hypothetical protein
MNFTDVYTVARHLFETQGPAAIAEAVRRAESFRKSGHEAGTRMWQRVESVLREMRGPHQS